MGFNSRVKLEKRTKKRGEPMYCIDLPGSDYDRFVMEVGPFIESTFHYKIPTGRTMFSRFGFMSVSMRQALLGSKLVNLDDLIFDTNF